MAAEEEASQNWKPEGKLVKELKGYRFVAVTTGPDTHKHNFIADYDVYEQKGVKKYYLVPNSLADLGPVEVPFIKPIETAPVETQAKPELSPEQEDKMAA